MLPCDEGVDLRLLRVAGVPGQRPRLRRCPVDQHHRRHPAASRSSYGSPRVHAELRLGQDLRCSRKRVERLMRQAGVAGIYRRRGRGCTPVGAQLGGHVADSPARAADLHSGPPAGPVGDRQPGLRNRRVFVGPRADPAPPPGAAPTVLAPAQHHRPTEARQIHQLRHRRTSVVSLASPLLIGNASTLRGMPKYRTFPPEQKAEIVLAGLRGDCSVRDICREW